MIICRIVEKDWYKKIKVLGLTVYKRELKDCYCYETYFKIFKKKHNPHKIIFYLAGIPILKIKREIKKEETREIIKNEIENALNDEMNILRNELERYRKIHELQLVAANLHPKTFGEFKNCNNNQNIVLVGSGPTLNYFTSISNAKYCGLNKAFLYDKIKFHYLFCNDNGLFSLGDVTEDYINYEGDNCIKFIGDHNGKPHWQIAESMTLKIKDCRRYKTNAWLYPSEFAFNIATQVLGNFCTVSLQAMQFLLYTNPKRIYLVGIDTSNTGHFAGSEFDEKVRNGLELDDLHNHARNEWYCLKEFHITYYPETEIISVNPVGLKGLFRDVYTKEYVKTNPEKFKYMKEDDIEYLEDLEKEESANA